jgi:hypothetical protein
LCRFDKLFQNEINLKILWRFIHIESKSKNKHCEINTTKIWGSNSVIPLWKLSELYPCLSVGKPIYETPLNFMLPNFTEVISTFHLVTTGQHYGELCIRIYLCCCRLIEHYSLRHLWTRWNIGLYLYVQYVTSKFLINADMIKPSIRTRIVTVCLCYLPWC